MLKVLKGARVLVDCATGELHMDCGDGACRPLGGGAGDVMHVFIMPEYYEDEGVFRGCNKTYQEIAEVYGTTPIVWHYFDRMNKDTYIGSYVQWEGHGAFNIEFPGESRVFFNEDNTVELYMAE